MIYKAYRFDTEQQAKSLISQENTPDDYLVYGYNAKFDEEENIIPATGYYIIGVWEKSENITWSEYSISPENSPIWWSGIPITENQIKISVPNEVTNFQARAAMRNFILQNGVSLETATATILRQNKENAEVLPESHETRIAADRAWLAWEQSNTFQRNSDLVRSLASELGLTNTQIDDLFIAASNIVA